jgi:N-acetylmuramoyl-L-alanine amidase
MTVIDLLSPNFNERTVVPDMCVLHYTGMRTAKAALDRMCDPGAEVSAHYCVDEAGQVYRLVAEERRAWHAGVSAWKGDSEVNGRSIGIEIVNPGHEFGYTDFPAAQIDAVIGLLDDVRTRWEIADSCILGHSDVAPARKVDPGEKFPWHTLAQHGHGLWPEAFDTFEPERESAMGPPLGPGDTGPGVFALQGALGKLGYAILPGGPYDEETATIVGAFQRHWHPEKIGTNGEGLADARTRLRLMALLRHISFTEL